VVAAAHVAVGAALGGSEADHSKSRPERDDHRRDPDEE
jgi:hypothetical protein